MGAYILIIYLKAAANFGAAAITMQEFASSQTCQAAGTRVWELSGREAMWSCLPK